MAEVHAGAADSGVSKLEGNYVTGQTFLLQAVVTHLWTHHLQVHEFPAHPPSSSPGSLWTALTV